RARQRVGRDTGKYIDGELGPDSRDAYEQEENLLFSKIVKAEKLQRVLSYVSMNLQFDGCANFRQSIKNIQRNENLVSHAADIDDGFAWNFLGQCPADLRDHISKRIGTKRGKNLGIC